MFQQYFLLKLLFLIGPFVLSCSSQRPQGKTKAEVLIKEASILVKKGNYILATEKLNNIRSKYPYSYYATHAELLQAEILFEQENYIEAAGAFILFKEFHPKHKKMAYVIWMIGESYYKQLPNTFDRDLAPGVEAMKYYRELITSFPESEHNKNSIDRIKFIQEQLELKEKYIADFYFKTKDYESARHRYLDILERFHSEKLRGHSMVQVLLSSYYLEKKDDCLKYYDLYRESVPKNITSVLEQAYSNCKTL